MQLIIKIIALLSSIIGVMAVVTGSKVLLGMFYPDYQYYTVLIIYNIIMGIISIIAGILIWKKNNKASLLAFFITSSHIIVLISLKIFFNDIISDHSINAMSFRSVVWIIFSIVIWKSLSKIEITTSSN